MISGFACFTNKCLKNILENTRFGIILSFTFIVSKVLLLCPWSAVNKNTNHFVVVVVAEFSSGLKERGVYN